MRPFVGSNLQRPTQRIVLRDPGWIEAEASRNLHQRRDPLSLDRLLDSLYCVIGKLWGEQIAAANLNALFGRGHQNEWRLQQEELRRRKEPPRFLRPKRGTQAGLAQGLPNLAADDGFHASLKGLSPLASPVQLFT